MKVYVAASFEQRDEVKNAHKQLRGAGHEISLDWTTHKWLQDNPKAEQLYSQYAVADVNGVLEADAYILLLGSRASTGAHIELGVALGSAKEHILLVGNIQQFTLFYRHPKIKHFASLEAAIRYLVKIRPKTRGK